jgi:hypothetical protein
MERNAPQGTRCTGLGCVVPTASQAHCTVCHSTFGGVTGFDKHRKDGWCLNPVTLKMALNDRGVWRTVPTEADLKRFKEMRDG